MEDEQVPVEMTGWIKAPVKLDCTGKSWTLVSLGIDACYPYCLGTYGVATVVSR